MGGDVRSKARQQGCHSSERMRFSNRHDAALAELAHESGCGSRHSHRNRGVCFGTQCHIQSQTQRAVRRRVQLPAERASQRAAHSRTQSSTDSGAETQSLCGVGCDVEGATGCHVEPRVHRATESRAKPLTDGHIHGRVVLGLEPRSQPGSDSPIAGSSAGSSLGPQPPFA